MFPRTTAPELGEEDAGVGVAGDQVALEELVVPADDEARMAPGVDPDVVRQRFGALKVGADVVALDAGCRSRSRR